MRGKNSARSGMNEWSCLIASRNRDVVCECGYDQLHVKPRFGLLYSHTLYRPPWRGTQTKIK
jgi:hypothetical protein